MKTQLKIVMMLSGMLFISNQVTAQDSTEETMNTSAIALLVPDLNELIDSALVYNGMVGYRKLEIEAKESNLKYKRQYWTTNFGVQADSRYGTFNNFSTISGENTSVALGSNTQQMNYNVGVYLKIPVFDVINRKSQIKQAKAELEQAKSLAKSQEDELRALVIRYYEDLMLKQNLLELRASNLGNAKANMEMVEREFKNGLIPISEYVRISDMTSRITAEFIEAKSNFLVSKQLLENITGIRIN